jgi:allophanate hydrolase
VSNSRSLPWNIGSLRRAYRDRTTTPSEVVAEAVAKIGEDATPGVWTHVRGRDSLVAEAQALERAHAAEGRPPLYGVPFAVKDSIDVGGMPTTVACPDYAFVAQSSAPVVARLVAAGAICIGKTNLDQFATGLVGVRSPYGIPPNAFDGRYVTGGSSSGSAAAVTRGEVGFSVATDTAGSGRVPAAFNHIVGYKPSRGLLSTRGVVPACLSIDCVSVLSLTCEDAREVASLAAGFDSQDPYSRREAARFSWRDRVQTRGARVGVPRAEDMVFCDEPTRGAFERACSRLRAMGAALEVVDMGPFFEAGELLYNGPWIAERLEGAEAFMREHPQALLPVIRTILADGERYRATDAFRAQHRLAVLKRATEPVWERVDALLLPTVPTIPRIEEVLADPIASNVRLGKYTTFANLLDLTAVSVPGGLRPDGLPSGVMFVGPWGRDCTVLSLASTFQTDAAEPLGATGWTWPPEPSGREVDGSTDTLPIAVLGAHMSGMALNRDLVGIGAHMVFRGQTAPLYRLYALPDTHPPKPGLVRTPLGNGARIELEVWAVPLAAVGAFLAAIPAPLGLGTVELDDGRRVHGFLCEAHAVVAAADISEFGGWRAYMRASQSRD